jgi:hypothetical protein
MGGDVHSNSASTTWQYVTCIVTASGVLQAEVPVRVCAAAQEAIACLLLYRQAACCASVCKWCKCGRVEGFTLLSQGSKIKHPNKELLCPSLRTSRKSRLSHRKEQLCHRGQNPDFSLSTSCCAFYCLGASTFGMTQTLPFNSLDNNIGSGRSSHYFESVQLSLRHQKVGSSAARREHSIAELIQWIALLQVGHSILL